MKKIAGNDLETKESLRGIPFLHNIVSLYLKVKFKHKNSTHKLTYSEMNVKDYVVLVEQRINNGKNVQCCNGYSEY